MNIILARASNNTSTLEKVARQTCKGKQKYQISNGPFYLHLASKKVRNSSACPAYTCRYNFDEIYEQVKVIWVYPQNPLDLLLLKCILY